MKQSILVFITLIIDLFILALPVVQQVFCDTLNHKSSQQQQQHARQTTTNIAEIISQNITFAKQTYPILINKDIIIRRDGKLTIEAGAQLLFDKRKGIIVYGTLEILGRPNDKVRLGLNSRSQLNNKNDINLSHHQYNQRQQQVRLVDGDLPSEGRVQIKFNDHWHSLCTQSKNLTTFDIKVLCNQVGYEDGQLLKWFPKRNDTTFQIMSKTFDCTGTETAITQCRRWGRIRAGGGVCNSHSDIGIRCSKKLFQGTQRFVHDYWRGIEFVHSDSMQEYVLEGQMKQRISKSLLQHLVITEAGQDDIGNATAAIRVFGQPPRMSDIEIKNSIYGIMIEEADDAIKFNNIRLTNNLASPIFVNTSWGKVEFDGMHIENNGGDAIRVVRHEKATVGSHDFCKFANWGTSQTYPVILTHEQQFLTSGRDCCQEFISQNQLTVHFPLLRSTPNNLLLDGDSNRRISVPSGVQIGKDAHLVIYDDYRDEFPFRLAIRNETRAQSIVSRSGRLRICYEPASFRTVLFTIAVVANEDIEEGTGIAHDVRISDSYLVRNEGRGIWIDNPRSGVKIWNTTVLYHNYVGGVHIENGTGEVIIQASHIANNTGHGLYINLAGGYYHIDNSSIRDNSLMGLWVDYDHRPELVAFNHTMHIGYSLISGNGQSGLFIGNVCRSDAFWNISMNSFVRNNEDAIVFQSCLPNKDLLYKFSNMTSRVPTSDVGEFAIKSGLQEVQVTHNKFHANTRRAIRMAPLFFVKASIKHNYFRDHQLAVLYINSQNSEDHLSNVSFQAPTNVRISSNRFYSNKGRYVVNIGLLEDASKQTMTFTKNYLEDNYITEPYSDLKPRSRVSAVVVVSSSNTKVVQNKFNNPMSAFDIGSHLETHSKIINATSNFWGYGLDAIAIYKRIFDRKNRYNLAQIEFIRYLLSPEDLEYKTDLSFEQERDKFPVFKNGTRLGGEVKGFEELDTDIYTVTDDIFIRPGGHLILKPGTVLKFQDGVGLMVQGRLDALGQNLSQILLTSAMPANRIPVRAQFTTTTTPAPFANAWVSHLGENGYETELANISLTSRRKNLFKRQTSNYGNVRLSHTTMGRLEVQIDGVWGPVCDYNFDIDDAAVVCQQLGMILNREDWLLERFQYAADEQQHISIMPSDAVMTNLRCDPSLDTDVTACKAEISTRGDFDGTCNSEVGIRCFPPSWSGLRFGMGADVSILEHVTIQRAGMFDYANYALKPALQIDFNRHKLSNLLIKSNSDTGLGILWNDVIGRHLDELQIVDGKFMNNERHGLELRSRGLTIRGCTFSNNRRSGLDYNPSFTQKELQDLLTWLKTAKNLNSVVSMTFPLTTSSFHVPSSEESFRFFIIQRSPRANITESFAIGTDQGHMLSIQMLNPIHPDSTEQLNMTLGLNPESPVWDLRTNATSFPMISPGYKFHFNYSTGSDPHGNVVLYIRSRYNNRDLKALTRHIPSHLVMPRFDLTANNINSKLINSLVIANCSVTKNGIGFKFRHSNHDHGPMSFFNRRYCNETTNITNNVFDGNHFSAILVSSDEYELSYDDANRFLTAPSEVRYNIVDNKIRRNKDGIRQFSRDIRYAYNVFHWNIRDNVVDLNRGGGVNLILPYFWRYDTNLSHTIDMSNNSFLKNVNFEMSVSGHFVMFNFTGNSLRENRCRNKLISLSGMEKRTFFRYNNIEHNICNRLIDFHINSHADKMGNLPTEFRFNAIRYNRRAVANSTYLTFISNFKYPKLLTKLHPEATDYALAVRGIQALNITNNLFVNPELRFELVVGIMIDPDERTVNAVNNYWGSLQLSDINNRVFDFDDWNSYASAELSPILIQESFYSATTIVEPHDFYVSQMSTSKTLGGRLTKNTLMLARNEPYIVESDLTVMPNVRLTIEPGAVLEFMPNVGILVLGELMAAGTSNRPIQMRPLLSSGDMLPLKNYLFPAKTRPNITLSNLNDPQSYEHNYAYRHYHFSYPIDLGSVRLCKNEICNDGSHIYENNVEDPILRKEVLQSNNNTWKMDGFLEIFNSTTLQWVPVCDPLLSEYTARVVCRQLGYTHLTLLRRGRRYTIEQEQIISIKNWPESVSCEGDESNLASCPLAATGFMNHSTTCYRESNQFVYIYCQDFPENQAEQMRNHQISSEHLHHWGGVRFACPSKTASSAPSWQDVALVGTTSVQQPRDTSLRSLLQHVSIDRAGMLHRHKAPSLQVLQCNVNMEFVSISNSAYHGVEIITSTGNQNIHQLRVRDSVGVGLNYLSLTGSSSAARMVPYLPLKHLDFSSDIFGLVDVCGASKEIRIDERLLLFYRYNSRPSDCEKIVSSKLRVKHVGIRMLQYDLFNSTSYTSRPDHLRIYDGRLDDRDSRLLVELGVTEKHRIERPELRFYQSSGNTMTIRLHASGYSSQFGFIAEVVTTPVSYNIQRDLHNNITYSELTGNKLGALVVASAGESTANLILKNNRFERNCMGLYGNFSSCINPIYMELQNCQRLRVINNLIKNNQGGLMIKSYSHSAVSALDAYIENNIFEGNQNTNVLSLLGPKTDPYQTVRVTQNYFTRNFAQYLSNIVLSRIVANFSANIISGNVGKHQIEVVGFDKLPLSYQTFANNWIYNNSATYERDQSTIYGNSAGQQYYMNYLVNPDNHFELSTMNWSRYDVKTFQVPRDDEMIHLVAGDGSSKDIFRKTVNEIPLNIVESKRSDLYHSTINARHNWWGFNTSAAIQGRIRDRSQHEELIKVDFLPFLETNRSVLSGVCAGGWQKVGGSCLVYIGTRMSYKEAQEFCDQERATLPLLRGNQEEITQFVQSQDRLFDSRIDRVWVRSFDVARDACPAINDYRTRKYNCMDFHAFICEKDPQAIITLIYWSWYREPIGLAALILLLTTTVLICCCLPCWFYKSKHRRNEKINRKNLMYASMRSSRGPFASNNSISENFLHRQLYSNEKSSSTDLSLSTQLTQPSNMNDEVHLVRTDPSARSSVRRNPNMRGSNSALYLQESNQQEQQQSKYRPIFDSPNRQPVTAMRQPPPPPPLMPPSRARTNPSPIYSDQQYQADYISPIPQSIVSSHETFVKTPTPVPSYKELHPKAVSSKSHSRSPSYNGSINGFEVNVNPMPVYDEHSYSGLGSQNSLSHAVRLSSAPNQRNMPPPPPMRDIRYEPMPNSNGLSINPPPLLSYQYSNIMLDRTQNGTGERRMSLEHDVSDQPEMDESGGSSVPTYYSNNTFEESTNSYLETYNVYNEAYGNARTQMIHSENFAHATTERTSITDLIMNSSQYTKTSTISDDNSQAELLTIRPRRASDLDLHRHDNNMNAAIDTNAIPSTLYDGDSVQYNAQISGLFPNQPSNHTVISKASSEIGSNRNWMETSFDDGDRDARAASHSVGADQRMPRLAMPTNRLNNSFTFGGSQQNLSPMPMTLEKQASDSKQGSRVYLETTFE